MFKWLNAFKWLVAGCMAAALSGCGYNNLQSTDEDIKATWAEVLNQYQRRADLVPNLVNVVKGYAAHEKDVFIQVTEARARVGAIQATPELINDEAAFQKFIAAQGELTGAISRLLLVAENYRNSRPTACSATCRRNSRAPRTASPSRATATSPR
jgi:LemA protein